MTKFTHFSQNELKVLQERARRIASTARSEESGDLKTVLTLRVGKENYVVEIDELTAVYEGISITPVPCVPSFVAGIANIRGHILPVLELCELVNSEDSDQDSSGALVVVSRDNMTIAFKVDEIGDVSAYSNQNVTSLTAKTESGKDKYLVGLLADGRAILDLGNLLTDSSIIVNDIIN